MECLIVFAKAPIEGEVKTRLSASAPLSPAETCALYNAFLNDTLACAARSRAGKVLLNFTPASAEAMMAGIARKHIDPARLVMLPQTEAPFPERIAASFAAADGLGAGRVVMTGSDSPHLQSRILNAAFDMLKRRGGCVAGPSGEGGLYLIGLSRGVRPDWQAVFAEGAELANLAAETKRLAAPFGLLEEVADVDVAADLVTVAALIAAMEAAGTEELPRHTAAELRRLRIGIQRNGGTRDKGIIRDG